MNPSDNDTSPLGGPLELPDAPAPARSHTPRTPKKLPVKKILVVIAVILLLALIGFGVTRVIGNDSPAESTKTSASPPSQTTATLKISDVSEVSGMKDFKSESLKVELKHPTTWTTTEANGGVRVESPEFNFLTTQGTVSGNFRIYIRQGAREVDSKYIGAGVAIKDSEKIAYTQPAAGQRKETNLSFFGLDDPEHFSYLFVAGNYSLKKGDTLGPSYGKEADTFLVVGGYSAKTLTDDFATYKIDTESYSKTKAYQQGIDIIKSLRLL